MSKRVTASTPKEAETVVNVYENERIMTIEKNAAKFAELGLHNYAKQLLDKQKINRKKQKGKVGSSYEEDQEYMPHDDDYVDEDLSDCSKEPDVRSSKKVRIGKNCASTRKKKQSSFPAMSMEEFIKTQQIECLEKQVQRRSKGEVAPHCDDDELFDSEPDMMSSPKNNEKSAPSMKKKPSMSMEEFMKTKQGECPEKHGQRMFKCPDAVEVSPNYDDEVFDSNDMFSDKVQTNEKSAATGKKQSPIPAMSMAAFVTTQQGERLEKQGQRRSKRLNATEAPPYNQSHNAGHQNMSVLVNQGQSVGNEILSTMMAPLENDEEFLDNQNDFDTTEVVEKIYRGPTMLHDVHQRKWHERVAMIFNSSNQPIGPETELSKFSLFLGTLASDPKWAPLTYTSWKKVPDTDMMWEYVNTKYILPTTAKYWVMQTIAASWKGFKCRIKAGHFYPYDNNADRWKNRPDRVPAPHFKTLLKHWSLPKVQAISDKNVENRNFQSNMHTVGPVSFARVFDKLLSEDKQPPSKRKMFEETKKRKASRIYKQSDDDTRDKIEKMRQIESSQEGNNEVQVDAFDEVMNKEHPDRLLLFGKGVSKKGFKGKETGTSVVVASEVLESLKINMQKEFDIHKESMQAEKEQLAKERETQAEMSKELDSQIAKLAEMQKEIREERENAAHDLATTAFARLRQMACDTNPETLKQALMSSIAAMPQ